MPLPDNLERLKHISIDTLGLSNSTSALLKWNGLTHVLDCIAFFYRIAQGRNAGRAWTRLFGLMFGEVKPALIAAGYWELVLDAEVWQVFREQKYDFSHRRVVCWQGRDIDLYEESLDQLGLSVPSMISRLDTVGYSIRYFFYLLLSEPEHWLDIRTYDDAAMSLDRIYDIDEYMIVIVQSRLRELGYWRFFEEHIDDFIEEHRIDEEDDDGEEDDDWEDDGDDD